MIKIAEGLNCAIVDLLPGNEKDDFAQIYNFLSRYLQQNEGKDCGLFVNIHEKHSLPDATDRAKFAKLVSSPNLRIAVVTNNALVFGVLTALRWIAKVDIKAKIFRDEKESVAWMNTFIKVPEKCIRF